MKSHSITLRKNQRGNQFKLVMRSRYPVLSTYSMPSAGITKETKMPLWSWHHPASSPGPSVPPSDQQCQAGTAARSEPPHGPRGLQFCPPSLEPKASSPAISKEAGRPGSSEAQRLRPVRLHPPQVILSRVYCTDLLDSCPAVGLLG